ncbi:MAG: hypothetical protein M1814_000559 [Vezdaea aestivalis]|nr:MAG: hypothetical protein M1814_000559 [Vezdaea aestivalis]
MFFSERSFCIFLGVLCLPLLPYVVHAGQSIDVSLIASFPSPPFLLELLETAAEEISAAYFPLLDRIAYGYFQSAKTDVELYIQFLNVLQDDGHVKDLPTLSSFKLALSLHSAAPRIASHYQSYETSVSASRECEQWLYHDGKQYCNLDAWNAEADIVNGVPKTLPLDRTFPLQKTEITYILYVDVSKPSFGPFFQEVREWTKARPNLSIVIRYQPSRLGGMDQLPLIVSGYGIEMALKRTDYIVIDDRESDKKETVEAEVEGSSNAQAVILGEEEEISDLKPLSASELTRLAMKASSFIASSENPFETLQKLSQDFPKYSSVVAAHNVTKEFNLEFYKNRQIFLPAGYNKIWINGLEISKREMEPFALLEHLRKEKNLIQKLQRIGLTSAEATKLLSHPAITESTSDGEPQRYDWRDDIEGGGTIMWLNNVEKDSRYQDWPTGLGGLLQRTYPGQLPTVRQNLHHVVFPIDFSSHEDVEVVVEVFQLFIKRSLPIRFGLVPRSNEKTSSDQARIVHHLINTYGIGSMLAYLEASFAQNSLQKPSKSAFVSAVQDRTVRKDQSALSFVELFGSSTASDYLERSQAYLDRLGVNYADAPILVNGVPVPRSEQWLQVMSQRVSLDLRILQQGVFENRFTDGSWPPEVFLASASARRNPLISPEDDASLQFLDVGQLAESSPEEFYSMPTIKATEDSDRHSRTQLILVADFLETWGRQLLSAASDFVKQTPSVELLLLYKSSGIDDGASNCGTGPEFKFEVEQNINLDRNDLDHIQAIYQGVGRPATKSKVEPKGICQEGGLRSLIETIGLQYSGEEAIIINGRLVRFPSGTRFSVEDFQTLMDFENKKRLQPILKAAEKADVLDKIRDAMAVAKLVSLVSSSTIPDTPEGIYESTPPARINDYISWATQHSGLVVGDPTTAFYQIVVALDPASQTAQRWVPILKVLSEVEGVALKISLNPVERLSELPIKGFYRQVLSAQPSFAADGSITPPSANFASLPKDALLTMSMEVPPAWLVVPKRSIHDLDNIKLSSIKDGSNIEAQYELEHILIEGHSREIPGGQPPKGAKFIIGTEKNPHYADTIAMANLGYFQFKANPGVWKLDLQAGRTKDIYNLTSAGTKGYKVTPGDDTLEVVLKSFQGKTLFPRLSRNPGKENDDVLESADSGRSGNAMDFVAKGVKMASEALSNMGLAKRKDDHADINIFSVASGHLYERMLNIMMVSVMRHTKHTVKFWFIENFLSPSFKDFIPTMAREYGFEYELVTYKWPHWLRAQSEKQREIWGYKILFLDVLFPLSLKKVIFVDADQIVRTDMYDLVQHDLEGAPYGFTPMCDSRTSMEGFRFWKQGYWANFLRGRPYHISALYVVDLVKFRAIAAGDRLRQQYHALSADPGSLSNLDQDLPNHMQHMLPIHSLPQSWLWCETWCSDEELADARTIDLCNNPQTKEPKLDRARRQIPEWTEYDDEIERLRKRKAEREPFEGGKNTKSRAHSESKPTAGSGKDEL